MAIKTRVSALPRANGKEFSTMKMYSINAMLAIEYISLQQNMTFTPSNSWYFNHLHNAAEEHYNIKIKRTSFTSAVQKLVANGVVSRSSIDDSLTIPSTTFEVLKDSRNHPAKFLIFKILHSMGSVSSFGKTSVQNIIQENLPFHSRNINTNRITRYLKMIENSGFISIERNHLNHISSISVITRTGELSSSEQFINELISSETPRDEKLEELLNMIRKFFDSEENQILVDGSSNLGTRIFIDKIFEIYQQTEAGNLTLISAMNEIRNVCIDFYDRISRASSNSNQEVRS